MAYHIYHDVVIKVPCAEVYKAVSQPEHLVNWWPLHCSGTPEVGASYNFFFEEPYNWYGKVIKASKDISFAIEMTVADEDWNPTSFGFDLEAIEEGCLVKFWHINWPYCNHHFRRSSYCWAMLLKLLKDYLEKGIIVPFEGRE
ncbi:SRPBCC family protein [Neptunitalea lumnitzerae]|uniref:Activator of Hsp90 ATPase homologue 1/2-like C-terminal domain-containing protein n=1 Tax=Neptunitalea lumnitzerae TaxID=2965509 RepID=A0ABQ5MH82_9FLAO|nr:SRPBCC domain-containing protein [Neptunitalea sp. Y10]GLB48764.1 hypothetical protein Y10_11320 [Neptunitalea sp. Y10]